jgi:hypothetical protein
LTANVLARHADVFLESGFDDFIAKPIDIRRLTSILNQFVRDKQPPEVLEAARLEQSRSENEKAVKTEISEADNNSAVALPETSLILDHKIPGLDISKGLTRYNNDEKAYIEMLKTYVDSVCSMLCWMDAYDFSDLNEYKVVVHGIKGASFEIYAGKIGDEAKTLEEAAGISDIEYIMENTPGFIENTKNFISSLKEMLSSIDHGIERSEKELPDSELLLQLSKACDAYDMDEVDAIMEKLEMFIYTSDDGLMDWLRKKVNLMSFTQIVEKLSELTEGQA